MKGNNFLKVFLFVALMTTCISALVFSWIITNGPIATAQKLQSGESIASMPETEMERAWDRTRDMVVAGFASNVAIAASGDAAQASMTRSFTSALWALAVMFVSVAIVLIVVSHKPSKQPKNVASLFIPEPDPVEVKARKN